MAPATCQLRVPSDRGDPERGSVFVAVMVGLQVIQTGITSPPSHASYLI